MSISVRYINAKDEYTLNDFLDTNKEAGDFDFNWCAPDIREMATDEDQTYWVGAFRNGKLIGICSIGEDDEIPSVNGNEAVILSDVYVLQEERGSGVGTKLVKNAIELARNEYPECDIHIQILDCELTEFYKKLGFGFDPERETGELIYSPEEEIDKI